jgi:glycosyltransferase involved in cell wall biosynthesis
VIAGPDFGVLDELRERAARSGIGERVDFPGAVFGTKKESLLGGAIALCQPSRHEGFSLTLLEALSHGVPVITTPESNLPAVLAAECGLVVRGDDAVALSSAMSALVGDRGMRERMSDAGRRLVARHYTWEKVAERALQLYGQCQAMPAANDPERLSTARTG